MIIRKNNAVLALSGAIPFALSISFAMYIFGFDWRWILLLIGVCVLIAFRAFQIILRRKHDGQRLKLEIESVSQVTNEIFGSFVVYPSWIFSLMGYRLYRVMLKNDIEVLLLSKQNVFNISKRTLNAVEIDNCCFMDVAK